MTSTEPSISNHDRTTLRDLAKRVAEIASLPTMQERRDMWTRHNSLERVRPMILVFPEGSWEELLPQSSLVCEGEATRAMEWNLRARIYTYEHFDDDTVCEGRWIVRRRITDTGWGLQARQTDSTMERGSWAFDPVIRGWDDLEKLRMPEVIVDDDGSTRDLEIAHELFGDILQVVQKGIAHISFHMMNVYTKLRGLEQVMVDMVEQPEMVHAAMSLLTEGHRQLVAQYQAMNLLSLNNDETYCSTGGNGYTRDLPAPGFDPDRVRPCDMWASAETQEFAVVSPRMHEEFAWQYERTLLEPFGLTGYGCCDPLHDKLHLVFSLPSMRRISVAPSADVIKCAEGIGKKAIFSWKPQPSHLVGEFDPSFIEKYIRSTLDVTRDCVIEMVLKDTHTCEHEPERFTEWTRVAKRLAEQY